MKEGPRLFVQRISGHDPVIMLERATVDEQYAAARELAGETPRDLLLSGQTVILWVDVSLAGALSGVYNPEDLLD